MEINNSLRAKFVKDNGLKIAVLESPYFEYFLDLYDDHKNCKRQYEKFLDMLSKFQDEEAYSKYWSSLIVEVVEVLKSNALCKNLLSKFDRSEEDDEIRKLKSIGSEVNKERFQNRLLVSIDLVEANFTSLVTCNSQAIMGAQNWYEFISKFTEHDYLRWNKQLRQTILGKTSFCSLNEKVQSRMMKRAAVHINKVTQQENEFLFVGNDEIYWLVPEIFYPEEAKVYAQVAVKNAHEAIFHQFKIRPLTIRKAHPERSWYIHEPACFCGWDGDIKMALTNEYAQAYKFWKKLPLNEMDLYFTQDGALAKYVEPLRTI